MRVASKLQGAPENGACCSWVCAGNVGVEIVEFLIVGGGGGVEEISQS